MDITKENLDHIIKLSHLAIPAEERENYLNDMKQTLDLMKSFDELDLSEVKPAAYAHAQAHYCREDEQIDKKDYLLEKNAPKWESDCFRVPQILGEADD